MQLWSIKPGWGSRPDIHVGDAHSDDITGLKFSTDGQVLLSRSMDSTLKVMLHYYSDQSIVDDFFLLFIYILQKFS